MGMYTTQLKTICESIIMHTRIKLLDGSLKYPTVDDLLNDPNYEFTYNNMLPDLSPFTLCYNDQVQAKIFMKNVDHTDLSADRKLYPCFDDKYRKDLQGKILLHYYTREICEETFGLWKLRLISKLNDIMPYYNQMYTETFEKYLGKDYNLFDNIDITTTDNFDKKIEKVVESVLNEEMKNKNTSKSSATETNSGKDTTHYKKTYQKDFGGAGYKDTHGNGGLTTIISDTPQGSVSFALSPNGDTEALSVSGYASKVSTEKGVILQRNFQKTLSNPEEYLDRDGSKDEYEHGHNINSSNQSSDNAQRNVNTTNDENERGKEKSKNTKIIHGKNSNQSYATLIKEIRENIINIDKMIIDELEPLFFGLW